MRVSCKILACLLAMAALPALAAAPAAKPRPAKQAAAAKPPAKTAAKTARPAQARPAPKPATQLAYIGTYTNETGRSDNHGQGIYAVEFDPKSGKLLNPRLAAKNPSPGWLVVDQARGILYAGNEYNGFGDERTGSISAFSIERTSGSLSLINTASAGGAPAYIARDPSGKFLLTANWTEGTISVVRIRDDGGVGEVTDVVQPTGPRNPEQSDDTPQGQFAASSHIHARPHMIGFDPSGKFAIVADAGLDRIAVFRLNTATGKLTPNDPPFFAEKPGSAPRHFVFGPKGFYALMEQASKLAVYSYDAAKGSFDLRQKLSTLPDGFAGSSLAAELLISGDGRFLYASNRLRDTITVFAAAKDGLVKKVGEVPCGNDYPRSLAFDPSGKFLFSMNQRGDDVAVFRIDDKTGLPHPTGQFLPVGSPGAMAFVEATGR